MLIAWENEALLAHRRARRETRSQIVVPSVSILAEPPVAVVDKVVARRGTREVAEAYLSFSIRRKARRSPRRITTARAIGRGARRSTRRIPEPNLLRSTSVRRLGQGAEARTSPMAASSTRSISQGRSGLRSTVFGLRSVGFVSQTVACRPQTVRP